MKKTLITIATTILVVIFLTGITTLAQDEDKIVSKALVDGATGEVVNVIATAEDSTYKPPDGYILISADETAKLSIAIGDIYKDGAVTKAIPAPVPIDWKQRYSEAKTSDDKLAVMAEMLGLTESVIKP